MMSDTEKENNAVNPQTRQNLLNAMHGEAFAYAKYMLFAEKARRRGWMEVAKLFEDAARTERLEHFAEQAELAGLSRDDVDNLRDAIHGETFEVETLYRKYAEQASAVGDERAAALFDEIRRDEEAHRNSFQSALHELETTLID